MATLSSRLNRCIQVFCAMTFGKYDTSIWNGETEYARYLWRGKVYHVPPYQYDKDTTDDTE